MHSDDEIHGYGIVLVNKVRTQQPGPSRKQTTITQVETQSHVFLEMELNPTPYPPWDDTFATRAII
jgi:hypothetical protein